MCPPGLAMASVAEPLWDTLPPSRSFYFDWRATRKAQEVFDAAFTPAVSLIRGLDVALGMILDDGLEAAFERHVRLGRAARAGVKAMGLELFSPDDDTSAVVTAVRAPDGVDGTDAAAPPARQARRHARAGPGRPEGEDLPHRPHRLVRRLRHRRRARRGRAVADRARRRHRARRRGAARVRGVRVSASPPEAAAMWPEPVQRVVVVHRPRRHRRDDPGVHGADADRRGRGARRRLPARADRQVARLRLRRRVRRSRSSRATAAPTPRRSPRAVGAAEVRVAKAKEVRRGDRLRAGRGRAVPDRTSSAVVMERTLLQHGTVWIGAGLAHAPRAHRARPTCSSSPSARTADLVERR